jgi:hypothetical protein
VAGVRLPPLTDEGDHSGFSFDTGDLDAVANGVAMADQGQGYKTFCGRQFE